MSSVAAKPEESNGGGFKLSGSFKPAGVKTDDRIDLPPKEASAFHSTLSCNIYPILEDHGSFHHVLVRDLNLACKVLWRSKTSR